LEDGGDDFPVRHRADGDEEEVSGSVGRGVAVLVGDDGLALDEVDGLVPRVLPVEGAGFAGPYAVGESLVVGLPEELALGDGVAVDYRFVGESPLVELDVGCGGLGDAGCGEGHGERPPGGVCL
ncbi:MAG: hypothetical protein OXK79_13575, partial [Chloroflexota bacterium]|nr:hypothetical protein [Chloroflexota bacterium]